MGFERLFGLGKGGNDSDRKKDDAAKTTIFKEGPIQQDMRSIQFTFPVQFMDNTVSQITTEYYMGWVYQNPYNQYITLDYDCIRSYIMENCQEDLEMRGKQYSRNPKTKEITFEPLDITIKHFQVIRLAKIMGLNYYMST